MNGKTCGICGRNDGEYKQEYKMPSGSVARDAMSFVQSWTLHEDAFNRGKLSIHMDTNCLFFPGSCAHCNPVSC